ncbi:MAG: YcaO-like family protein, partial [Pseudomonadota bacterium]
TVPLQCASLQRGSNGLASGNTIGEAIYHALCEVIERDCIADFERRTPRSRARAVQSSDDLRAYGAGALMDKIGEAEMILRVWDITNDLGVPAFRALLYDVGTQGPGKYVHPPKVGYGCHLDPKVAVSRAITEAAQSRLVAISGARDDLVPEDYALPQMGNALVALTSIADAAAAGNCKARHISSASASAETDSRFLLQRLAERGLDQVAGFDLTHPEIGLPVVRILAPGLGGLSTGHRSYAGTRHKKVSVQ